MVLPCHPYVEIGKYLKIMYTDEELKGHNLKSVLPKRTVEEEGRSRRPVTIAYLDTAEEYTRTQGQEETREPKWTWDKVREPTLLQR